MLGYRIEKAFYLGVTVKYATSRIQSVVQNAFPIFLRTAAFHAPWVYIYIEYNEIYSTTLTERSVFNRTMEPYFHSPLLYIA